jgi:hypothetical protein
MESKPSQTKIEQELSLEEKEIAKSLEDLQLKQLIEKEDLPLKQLIEKFFLILVWRKLKDSTVLVFDPNTSEEILNNVKRVLKKSGLFYEENIDNRSKDKRSVIFVSNKQKSLGDLSRLFFGNHFEPENYLKMGKLFSFPDTAIDAFHQTHKDSRGDQKVSDEYLLTVDEMKEKISKNIIPFVQFRVSRKNWEQEAEEVKKWVEELKRVAPDLYNKILNFSPHSSNK